VAFPQIVDADTKNGVQTSNSLTWTLTYPTNLQSGDLILALLASDGNTLPVWPLGFVQRDGNTGAVSLHWAKKLSGGTESGTFSVTLSASESGGWRVFRITNWGGTLGTDYTNGDATRDLGTFDTNANPNPGEHSPTWGAADTLWIAACGVDTSRTISVYPLTGRNTADVSGGSGGATLGVCTTESAVGFLDPGTFTISNSDDWSTSTTAIRPAAGGPAVNPPYRNSMPPLIAQ
jgi:hypothetical protein